MTAPELQNQLLDFINTEVSLADETVLAGTDLMMTGAVDSLGVMRITQWLEDEAGIRVDPTDVTLDNFQTVDKMLAYCQSKTG